MAKPLRLLLVILPLFLILLSFHQKSSISNYHMYVSDPEYAYLLNGLNICNLSTPTHVIGPGTPLQVLSAIVIEVVYFFRTTADSMNVDVLKNPDVYCSAINSFSIIILTLFLLIGGLVIYRATKSVVTGLFFQLIPFTKWVLLDLNSRIMVETLIIGFVVLLMAYILKYIHDEKAESEKWFNKYTIGFALLIGFIGSLKFVYLPLSIIPFVMLRGTKQRLFYTISGIVIFFILSFPVLFHWVAFRDWYIDNFFHSGMYGSGQAKIIDAEIFKNNLKQIFLKDTFFLITFLASALTVPLYFIPFFKLKKKNDKEFVAFLGVFITLVILTFLVSKQYKEYYLTVNFLLIVPIWYFILRILSRAFRAEVFKYIQLTALVILGYVVWLSGPKLVLDYHSIREAKDEKYLESFHYVEQNFNSENPVIVIADYYGAPFKEYGIYFGMGWCGYSMGQVYAQDLTKLYPNIYFFHGWNNSFNHWNTNHSFIELVKNYKELTFFSGDKVVEESLRSKLKGINRQIDTKWEVVKTFDKLGQTFYEVKYDSVAAKIASYVCDAETNDSVGVYLINELGQQFEGAPYVSNEFSRSGDRSIKIYKDQKGFTCSLSEVQKGEQYLVEVWRKSTSPNSVLLIQTNNEQEFLLKTSSSASSEGEWEKLSITFTIADNIHQKDLTIYCVNDDEENAAYFDDLEIRKIF